MKCAATILCVLFPFAAAFAQSASATLRPLPLDCKATGQPSFVIKSQNQLPRVGALFFGPMLSGAAIDEKALGHSFQTVHAVFWFAPSADGKQLPLALLGGGRSICGRIAVRPFSMHAASLPLALWQAIGPKEIAYAFRMPNVPALLGTKFYAQGALLYEGSTQWTMRLSRNYVEYVAGY